MTDSKARIQAFERIGCEQAFGRAGNWGEGKAPLSLPFPRYFFPKQRASSEAFECL